jgi:hypothetical protein
MGIVFLSSARANSCCFDTNLPPIGGLVQVVNDGVCFPRPGVQIFLAGFAQATQTRCHFKPNPTNACCSLAAAGLVFQGCCSSIDATFENAQVSVPTLSEWNAVALLLLLAGGGTWMVLRRLH